jgi:hypothetical protein
VRGVWRVVLLAAGTAVAVALFFVFRGEDDTERTPKTTQRSTTRTQARPRRPRPVFVKLEIEQGRPRGGIRRLTVSRGRRITLLVESDTADEVHVHGYDLRRRVGGGRTIGITFEADILGRFEVELEDRRVQIADITVRP